jgi:hypothetical protein
MPKKKEKLRKKRYKNFVGIQKVLTFASAFEREAKTKLVL